MSEQGNPEAGHSLARYIDHTLLKPDATPAAISQLCKEALEVHFKAVCVSGAHVEAAVRMLENSPVAVACVVGFPLGSSSTAAKICEARAYRDSGAAELDVVLNIGWLKSGETARVAEELQALREAVPEVVLKLILETCYLTNAEKESACRMALTAKWDFVKTSTGFGTGGATLSDVRLMKRLAGDAMEVKASGGIRDRDTALAFIAAGATRIGTSSGLRILHSS